jgi:ribosomal protein S12 methylthiotransferase accessory factor
MTIQAPAAPSIPDNVADICAAAGVAAPVLRALDWVALLPSAAAPRFVYLAGACGGVPVGGGGRDLAEAAARLAGEAAEALAQAAGPLPCDDPPDPAIDALWAAGPVTRRVAALNVNTGRRVGVPTGAIFSVDRAPAAPPASLGLAAGSDRTAARLAGLLELIERDAAAGWWNGGAAPRQLAAVPDVAPLRAGARLHRVTAFLELPSVTGVPVVCAVSRDPDGGLAFGLKAAPDPKVAAAGALIELLQMEIALEMARLRSGRGAATPGDRGVLARAALDPDAFPAFSALLPADRAPVPADFDALAAHLAGLGIEVTVADLPVPSGVPAVAKVFAPALRPLPGPGPVHPAAPGACAALL